MHVYADTEICNDTPARILICSYHGQVPHLYDHKQPTPLDQKGTKFAQQQVAGASKLNILSRIYRNKPNK